MKILMLGKRILHFAGVRVFRDYFPTQRSQLVRRQQKLGTEQHSEMRSSQDLLAEQLLKRLAVPREPTNTFVQLVVRHLIFAQSPAEFRLVIDVRNLRDRLALGS